MRGGDRLGGDRHLMNRAIARSPRVSRDVRRRNRRCRRRDRYRFPRRRIRLSPTPPSPDTESFRLSRRSPTPAACDSIRTAAARLRRGCRSQWTESVCSDHATERRERLERRGRIRVGRIRRRERAGGHGLSRQHPSVRHRRLRQRFARNRRWRCCIHCGRASPHRAGQSRRRFSCVEV